MRKEREKRAARRSVYTMIVVVALAIAAGRIAVVAGKEGTAFLCANDKSRWCTVAALVEDGCYEIDRFQELSHPVMRNRKPWRTIDKVVHIGDDGIRHQYSSKPPLLPTMVAGVYWVVSTVSGTTMTEHPTYVARIVLALVNLPLLAVFFIGTIDAIDRVCASDWTRTVAALACCFATMVFPFSVTLNNHLPAAAATAAALWCYVYAAERLERDKDWKPHTVPHCIWIAAGLAAAFTAANELPALSMLVLWGYLFYKLDHTSLLPFGIGVAIVAVAFFATNWIAHSSLRPPYAHRGNGSLIAELKTTASEPNQAIAEEAESILLARRSMGTLDQNDMPAMNIEPSLEPNRWIVKADQEWFALLKNGTTWRLHRWDDWYEYPGTYWSDQYRVGVDRGEPSRLVYFFHMTVGHHGILSLTPLWLLLPIGLGSGLRSGLLDYRRLALAVLVATVVCVSFYAARPLIDRNYGGVSVCLRWLLWFTPLWMIMIATPMQRLSEGKGGRFVLLTLLALSVFSMSTAIANPWQHPWLYRYLSFLQLIEP